MDSTRAWLDPKTREILGAEPPPPEAPARLPDYSLVLLRPGPDTGRTARAFRRATGCDESAALARLTEGVPQVVAEDLSIEDALLGQFEFVCCDAVSVFLSAEVAKEADLAYLADLYGRLLASPEFEPVEVTVVEVPRSPEGRRFVDQFLGFDFEGESFPTFPVSMVAPRKKARIMKHWARKTGGSILLG